MIKGGYILQPRIIDQSEMMHRPPIERELWMYLLRHVNHESNDRFPRGTGFFQLTQIAEDLSWMVGARKMKYKIPALSKALRRLDEASATATTRATRGIVVTVCNYDYYQDASNYEGNDERATKATRRQSVKQECKNDNNREDKSSLVEGAAWRKDFEVYLSDLRLAYSQLIKDETYIAEQQKFNPGVDIKLTLEKACTTFWATEAGWKNKKSKRGTQTIDWKSTLTNAISQRQNKVYLSNGHQRNSTKDIPSDASGYKTTI